MVRKFPVAGRHRVRQSPRRYLNGKVETCSPTRPTSFSQTRAFKSKAKVALTIPSEAGSSLPDTEFRIRMILNIKLKEWNRPVLSTLQGIKVLLTHNWTAIS